MEVPVLNRRGEALRVLQAGWRDHGLALCLVSVHALFAYLGALSGLYTLRRHLFDVTCVRFLLLAALAWLPLLLASEIHRTGHIRGALGAMRSRYLKAEAVLGVVLAAVIFSHSAIVHDGWKQLLGVVNPYSWDTRLAVIDRAIHGADPWRLTHSVFGSPRATLAIDWIYWLWYPFLWAAFSWMAWTHRRLLRRRVLLTWALMWIVLGTVVAHSMASGGPIFYGRLVAGPDPFAELAQRLEAIGSSYPLHALPLQRGVWANTEAGGGAYWIAMSAMPSLHVAAPAVFALAATQVSRWLGWALWLFVALTFVGSIHLGWHYAVDGEVAIVGVIACWWVVGRIVPDCTQHDAR